jgi:hypothetical protein
MIGEISEILFSDENVNPTIDEESGVNELHNPMTFDHMLPMFLPGSFSYQMWYYL